VSDAFYLPRGDGRYVATGATEGPWGPEAQHGGPPTALLVHALEHSSGREELATTRVSAEFLSPVPVGEVAVETHPVKQGRNAELLEAVLTAGGRSVMRARVWRLPARWNGG
jgi:Thioesterase-like superfamily